MDTQQIVDRARLWADYYEQVQAQRALVRFDAEHALEALKARLIPVTAGGKPAWRVLPLGPGDAETLRTVSAAVTLAPVSTEAADATRQLEHDVPEALADIDAVAGAKRRLARPAAREAADDAVEFLTEYVAWGEEEGLVTTLKGMEPAPPTDADSDEDTAAITAADALAPHVGLGAIWRKVGVAEMAEAPTGPAPDGAAPDVVALHAAIAEHAATHLAVFSTGSHTAAGLLTVLRA